MKRKYSIREYEYFTRNICVEEKGYYSLPEDIFDYLFMYVLPNPSEEMEENKELFIPRHKKRMGIVLQAKNYVGAILLKDGTTIEILPKITDDLEIGEKEQRIFMEMLKYSQSVPIRNIGTASLAVERYGLFQWFINVFLKETEYLVKKGLCNSYQLEEGNEPFLKGKLIFSKHIMQNTVQKQKFYIEKDNFYENRPENRLIKTTLEKLRKETKIKDKQAIVALLAHFENVPLSFQIEEDFKACRKDRHTRNYDSVLSWCKIFLKQHKFSSFYGDEYYLSVLFPMDLLYEKFVSKKIYHRFYNESHSIKLQAKGTYLFNFPNKRFEIKPDIIIYPTKSALPVIFDTKWKILDQNKKNFGINQDDMYQMYVYGSCYHAKKVILLYPKIKDIDGDIILGKNDEIEIKVMWIDLFHMEDSMDKVQRELKNRIKE